MVRHTDEGAATPEGMAAQTLHSVTCERGIRSDTKSVLFVHHSASIAVDNVRSSAHIVDPTRCHVNDCLLGEQVAAVDVDTTATSQTHHPRLEFALLIGRMRPADTDEERDESVALAV